MLDGWKQGRRSVQHRAQGLTDGVRAPRKGGHGESRQHGPESWDWRKGCKNKGVQSILVNHGSYVL